MSTNGNAPSLKPNSQPSTQGGEGRFGVNLPEASGMSTAAFWTKWACYRLYIGPYLEMSKKWPFVNILWDIYGNPREATAISEILNSLAIIVGIVLSIALTLPLSFNYEEQQDLIQRYDPSNSASPYSSCSFDGYDIIENFNLQATQAIVNSTMSIIVIVLSMLQNSLEQRNFDTGNLVMGLKTAESLREYHWHTFAVKLIIATIMLVCAIFNLNSCVRYYLVSLVNPYVEQRGSCPSSWKIMDGASMKPYTVSNVWGYWYYQTTTAEWTIAMLFFSQWSYSVYLTQYHARDGSYRQKEKAAQLVASKNNPSSA